MSSKLLLIGCLAVIRDGNFVPLASDLSVYLYKSWAKQLIDIHIESVKIKKKKNLQFCQTFFP